MLLQLLYILYFESEIVVNSPKTLKMSLVHKNIDIHIIVKLLALWAELVS